MDSAPWLMCHKIKSNPKQSISYNDNHYAKHASSLYEDFCLSFVKMSKLRQRPSQEVLLFLLKTHSIK